MVWFNPVKMNDSIFVSYYVDIWIKIVNLDMYYFNWYFREILYLSTSAKALGVTVSDKLISRALIFQSVIMGRAVAEDTQRQT